MSGLFGVRWLLPLIAVLLSACAPEPQVPGEARIPRGAWVSHKAVFIGTNGHDTEGTISLYQSREYPLIVFEPNFRVTDPAGAVIALGANGYRAETVIGHLVRSSGRQAYAIPPGLDLRLFNEVWLWSPDADTPVGIARLTPI